MLLGSNMCCYGNSHFLGGFDVSHVVTQVRGDFFFPLSPRDTRQRLSSFHYALDFFLFFLSSDVKEVELSLFWNVHLSCLGMRTVRSNLSSTILWKRDSSVRDLGKQGAHFKAEIAVEMEHFF